MAKSDKDNAKEKDSAEKVSTGGWNDSVKVRTRKFNGPAAADEPLRIAMSKEAYADVIGHAKETLDREICGVLLGDLCEDEYGFFLQIDAALRGGAAKAGGTHVTFTQETWNEIHKAKEERYPKLQIVGWYHSHPGFGVEFSDMDLFIQKNFFGGAGQIALVTDPLGGEEAIDANVHGEITPIRRFWVDGRERKCYVPPSAAAKAEALAGTAASGGASGESGGSGAGGGGATSETGKALEDLRDRVRQLTEAVEQQRTFFYNVLTVVGMIVAVCAILGAGYAIWRSYTRPLVPPEDMSTQNIVMMADGKPVLVSVAVKKWELPPESAAAILQEFEQAIADKHAAEAAATRAATQNATRNATKNAAASASASAPALASASASAPATAPATSIPAATAPATTAH